MSVVARTKRRSLFEYSLLEEYAIGSSRLCQSEFRLPGLLNRIFTKITAHKVSRINPVPAIILSWRTIFSPLFILWELPRYLDLLNQQFLLKIMKKKRKG